MIASQGARGHLKRLAWLYGYDAAPDPADTRHQERCVPTPIERGLALALAEFVVSTAASKKVKAPACLSRRNPSSP